MAPRSSTGFAKRPPAPQVEAKRAEPQPRPLPDEPEAAEPIPLDLAPLIAPYRRNGRITLRVERMPHRARLSHGQINGDRSFSLALDELDGLLYLPPPGGGDPPTLGIRVIRVNASDATTLALLDYPVSSDTTVSSAVALNENKEQRRLRDEVVKLKALLAARDSELAEVQAVTGESAKAESPPARLEIDFVALRAAWDIEAEHRVAEAVQEATTRFEKQRNLAENGEVERKAAIEKEVQDLIGQERARHRKESDAALRRAEQDWQAAETARAAAVDADWQKRLDNALIDTQTLAGTRANNEAELRKLRDDLKKTNKMLADRDAEVARERNTATRSRDDVVRQHAQDLERLRGELITAKDEIAERERQLAQQRDVAKSARNDTDRKKSAELDRLRRELEGAKTALANRDSELARERESVRQKNDEVEALRGADHGRQRLQEELDRLSRILRQKSDEIEALRGADHERQQVHDELDRLNRTLREKSNEIETLRGADQERQGLHDELDRVNRILRERDQDIVRLRADADAESHSGETKLARLSEDLAKVRAALSGRESELKHARSGEEQVRAEAENLRGDSAELKRVTAELVSTKASLAVRDAELAQTRGEIDDERERLRKDADASLGEAKRVFKESEAERLAAAEAEWRKQSDLAIADVVARLHDAETRLRESTGQSEKTGSELERLREARAALKSQLAERNSELLQTRLSQEHARERWKREMEEALQKAQDAWKADETARIAASETLMKDQNTIALNEATARLKHTETLLTEARAQVETLRHRGDPEDVARLRKDFASAQAALARREQELMEARTDHEMERVRLANEARDRVQRADLQWHDEDPDATERAQRRQKIFAIVRNTLLVVIFVGLAAVVYYKVAPAVSLQASRVLGQDDGDDGSATPAPSTTVQTSATVAKSVNLRDGASATAKVIGSVPRDTKVRVLEHRGKWVRIEMPGDGKSKALQGWAFSTYLKDLPAPAKTPSPPPAK